MSSAIAIVLLALVTAGWFTLALAPALLELRNRGDVEPLQLRRGGGDVRHFALGFQRFVDDALEALTGDASSIPTSGHAVILADGEPAWHVPRRRAAVTLPVRLMPPDALATHVIISEEELTVPNESSLLKELYVARDLRGGNDCFYRAVLACAHASLGARSGVLRWIDVAEVLVVGESSTLYGRASAGREMRLYDGVRFQRVAAPLIVFGTPGGTPATADERTVATRPQVPLEPPAGVTESFGRWVIEGDFDVGAGEYVTADLIVNGTLRVGAGARLGGAVKCAVLHGTADVSYEGAVVATSRVELGSESAVAGPIVAEGEVVIGRGARIGTAEDPTTISAVTVQVARAVVVCGEIWAREGGVVEGTPVRRQLDSGGWDVVR